MSSCFGSRTMAIGTFFNTAIFRTVPRYKFLGRIEESVHHSSNAELRCSAVNLCVLRKHYEFAKESFPTRILRCSGSWKQEKVTVVLEDTLL